jgi:predicted Zn-dependent protease
MCACHFFSSLYKPLQKITPDALKTLQTAAAQNPDDHFVKQQMGDTLLRLNRKDEAAAVAKSLLENTEDPGVNWGKYSWNSGNSQPTLSRLQCTITMCAIWEDLGPLANLQK